MVPVRVGQRGTVLLAAATAIHLSPRYCMVTRKNPLLGAVEISCHSLDIGVLYCAYVGLRNAKDQADCFLQEAASNRQSSYLGALSVGQFCARVALAAQRPAPSPAARVAVGHVLKMTPQPKMAGIYAARIITMMQDTKAVWDRPTRDFICHARGDKLLPVKSEASIPRRRTARLPRPAFFI